MFASACSDQAMPSTAPTATAVNSSAEAYAAKAATKSPTIRLSSGTTKVNVLAFQSGVNTSVTASKVIGSEGGILSLSETGLTLIVPRGAVSAPTTFRVTPVGGRYVAYDFEPHGTTFAVPLTFMQDLSKTKYSSGAAMRGAYFADKALVDGTAGSADVSELFSLFFDDFGFTFFSITHFSGYLVSMA
jgi:hypothetical protein